MHRAVSEAVAASLAEATPDSLGSHNYYYRRAAAGLSTPTAADRNAVPEGYPVGTRRGKMTPGCMAAQHTVGSVVTTEMARAGCQ